MVVVPLNRKEWDNAARDLQRFVPPTLAWDVEREDASTWPAKEFAGVFAETNQLVKHTRCWQRVEDISTTDDNIWTHGLYEGIRI